jgi:hypothetical protein
VFLVRYGLDLYILFRRNSHFKGLNENRVEHRKVFLLTLDSVSLFAIVLLIPVSSISMYPSPSCFGTLGLGGLAGVGAAAFGVVGGGTT